MVSPSLVASLITFIAVGIFTFVLNQPNISESASIQSITFIVIFLNAIYYFYYELYSELDKNMTDSLAKITRYEWLLRLIGQCILYSLWFLLEFGWIWFHIGLLSLYIVYIFWNHLTWEKHPKNILALIDFFGLLLASFFLFINVRGLFSKYGHEFCMGIVALGYLLITIFGIGIAKFNPFNLKHWRKTI